MLIRNFDGCVIVTPELAALFAPILSDELKARNRRDGIKYPSVVWNCVDALETAGRARRDRKAGVVAAVVAAIPAATTPVTVTGVNGLATSPNEWLVSQIADALGVSKEAIHRRCRRGTLPFRVDERGRRWIRLEDVGLDEGSEAA